MKSKALDSALAKLGVKDGELIAAGRPVSEWAREVGTPCYLYDPQVLRGKISLFREVMPSEVNLFYALKANPFSGLLEEIVPLVDGFDVASVGELEAVLAAGGKAESVSFAGPGKSRAELARALELGIGSLNLESARELELLIEEGERLGRRPRVSIRINPDFELSGSGMMMGGGAKQFGIDAEQVPEVLERIADAPVDLVGFHIYAGSQNLQASVLCEVMEQTLSLISELAGERAASIQMLNLGGGFGIPYFDKDEPLDIAAVGAHLAAILPGYRERFPAARFVIELGRYLVGECGLYVAEVLYTKRSRDKTFVVIDGGMNHHLAASGNFGTVLRKNFPMVVAGKVDRPDAGKVDVVGPLCTPLDLLGKRVDLPAVEEGDQIVILASGAYGYTASPLLFLGHGPPRERVLK
jgi:diaminopimelate decarboxylase